jgi:hypothetical protein
LISPKLLEINLKLYDSNSESAYGKYIKIHPHNHQSILFRNYKGQVSKCGYVSGEALFISNLKRQSILHVLAQYYNLRVMA